MADTRNGEIGESGHDCHHIELDIKLAQDGDEQPTKDVAIQTEDTDEATSGGKKRSININKKDVKEAASCFRQIFKFFWKLNDDDDDDDE